MGGFLGIGHSSAKTDRSNFLHGIQDIQNVFNYALPTAQAGQAEGAGNLRTAGDYYKNILSGNRTAALQAIAPETASVRRASDASKRQLATSGTARGGGVAATNQQRETDTMSEINNALFGARPAAAKGLTQVAGAQLSAAFQALGLSAEEANTFTEESRLSRPESFKENQDIVGKVTQAIVNALGALPIPA